MYEFEIKPPLKKKLRKFKYKDLATFRRIRSKISEVRQNPLHYKPLKNDLKGRRRAHIGHFVLIFYLQGNVIYFIDYEHHDKAYL